MNWIICCIDARSDFFIYRVVQKYGSNLGKNILWKLIICCIYILSDFFAYRLVQKYGSNLIEHVLYKLTICCIDILSDFFVYWLVQKIEVIWVKMFYTQNFGTDSNRNMESNWSSSYHKFNFGVFFFLHLQFAFTKYALF